MPVYIAYLVHQLSIKMVVERKFCPMLLPVFVVVGLLAPFLSKYGHIVNIRPISSLFTSPSMRKKTHHSKVIVVIIECNTRKAADSLVKGMTHRDSVSPTCPLICFFNEPILASFSVYFRLFNMS